MHICLCLEAIKDILRNVFKGGSKLLTLLNKFINYFVNVPKKLDLTFDFKSCYYILEKSWFSGKNFINWFFKQQLYLNLLKYASWQNFRKFLKFFYRRPYGSKSGFQSLVHDFVWDTPKNSVWTNRSYFRLKISFSFLQVLLFIKVCDAFHNFERFKFLDNSVNISSILINLKFEVYMRVLIVLIKAHFFPLSLNW